MIPTTTRLIPAAVLLACLLAGPAYAQGAAPAPAPHDHGAAPAAPSASSDAPARAPAQADAYNYIGWPLDGTVIRSTRVKVWFGARNIGVAPAGVEVANTGHHHLLIDVPLPDDMTVAIPNDRNHLHFGRGQTETVLELAPGRHTLQLLMGDANHVPHDPPVHSRRITILIRPGPAPRAAAQ